MTTQIPHGPTAPVDLPQQLNPPASTYSTAPPWAAVPWTAAPEAAPVASLPPSYGTVAPYGSPLPEHGQLLVPYPEEMQHAAQVEAPAWWPVVLWTLLAGIPGLISANRRATQARRGHNSPGPYWIAFAVSLSVVVSLAVVAKPAAVDAWHEFRERAYTQALQQNLVKDDQLTKSARVTATSAQCEPAGARDADDQRRYSCLLKLDDGRTGTLDVTADSDGNWTAAPRKK